MGKSKRNQNQKAKGRPQKPEIKIPFSPSNTSKNASAIEPDSSAIPGDLHSSDERSSFETPPTSPLPVERQEEGESKNVDDQAQMTAPDQHQDHTQGESQQSSNDAVQHPEETHLVAKPQEDAPAPSEHPEVQQPTPETKEQETMENDTENTQVLGDREDSSSTPVGGAGDPNNPVQHREETPLPAENRGDALAPSEDPVEQTIPETQEREALADDAENPHVLGNAENSSHTPVGGDGDPNNLEQRQEEMLLPVENHGGALAPSEDPGVQNPSPETQEQETVEDEPENTQVLGDRDDSSHTPVGGEEDPNNPVQHQEETPLPAEKHGDALASSEDPGQQTIPETQEPETPADGPENMQDSGNGEASSHPSGGGEGVSPPVENPDDQKELEPTKEEQSSDSPAEGQELRLPADEQKQPQSPTQPQDEPRPVPEGEAQMQIPIQDRPPSEEGQKELLPLPTEDEAQIESSEQDQEQRLEQASQPKTEDNNQQLREGEQQQDRDPEPSSSPQDAHVDHSMHPLSPINANDVASKDISAIANALSTMKTTLIAMADAFNHLDQQTETMISLSLDLKAVEQIRRVQSALERQIARHKLEIESLRSTLRDKIKQAVEDKIRNQVMDVIRGSLKEEVKEKVRNQLAIQIPENLRQQVIAHKRQILEVRASLHNSEARRHNSLQTVPGPHARLRPLLRPLPTPEQSPVILISRSSSMEPSTFPTPSTAFPQAPAPTPIKRVSSNSLRSAQVAEAPPPTPSRLFPRDLTALFALSQGEARALLREYGLDSATSSPTKESARPRGLSIVTEESPDTVHDEDPDAHARDLNKFMAHIGVPFLMIPAPKEKVDLSAPLSSRSRRKLLTPLIIK